MIDMLPEGFTFGAVDNGIVLAGMYMGVDIEGWLARKLGKKSNPLLGAVIGATGFNAVSDGAAAAIDPAMHGMTAGVMLGCLAVMILIPVIEKYRNKNEDR
jgi:Na+/melibiose symporter-like transporter